MSAMIRIAAAEWLKLRSVRSTWWFMGGALLLVLMLSALGGQSTASDVAAQGGMPGSVETASTAMSAVGWVHFVFGGLGMLAITSEYATRSIVTTLACAPSRSRLLLAKAAVLAAAVFVAAALICAAGVAAGAPLLGRYGHFDAGQVALRILAMATYLALIALLALGIGALIRRSAGTITVVFGLLLVLPNLLVALATPLRAEFLLTIARYTPSSAGELFIAGEPLYGLVVAAWAAAAVAAGIWALRARDA